MAAAAVCSEGIYAVYPFVSDKTLKLHVHTQEHGCARRPTRENPANKQRITNGGRRRYYACSTAKTRYEASVKRVNKPSQRKRIGLLSANAVRGKSEVAQYRYESGSKWQQYMLADCRERSNVRQSLRISVSHGIVHFLRSIVPSFRS